MMSSNPGNIVLKEMIKREIFSHLQNRMVVLSFVSILLIVCANSYVQTNSYHKKQKEYTEYMASKETIFKNATFGTTKTQFFWISKPPAKLGMLCNGVGQLQGQTSTDKDAVAYIFSSADYLTIVGMLLSLVAILFSFDAISGEKEAGILRLTFSNAIKPSQYLTGKILGGLCCFIFILLLCYLVMLCIILTFGHVQWGRDEIVSLILIFVSSVCYVSVFFLLGLYISIRSKTSGQSMVVGLLCWGIWVLVFPSLPAYFGKLISPMSSSASFLYESEIQMQKEWRRAINNAVKPYYDQGYDYDAAQVLSLQERKIIDSVMSVRQRKIQQTFSVKSEGQVISAACLSALSPYTAFMLSGNELAATGILAQIDFRLYSRDYLRILNPYIQNQQHKVWQETHQGDWETKVDLSGRPLENYHERALSKRLLWGGVTMVPIWIYGILLIILSYKKFRSYDFR